MVLYFETIVNSSCTFFQKKKMIELMRVDERSVPLVRHERETLKYRQYATLLFGTIVDTSGAPKAIGVLKILCFEGPSRETLIRA